MFIVSSDALGNTFFFGIFTSFMTIRFVVEVRRENLFSILGVDRFRIFFFSRKFRMRSFSYRVYIINRSVIGELVILEVG